VKIVPFCMHFVTHLICASLARIKAAKSRNCIIDKANINIRGDTVDRNGSQGEIINSSQSAHGPLKHTGESGHLHRFYAYHCLHR
jgi:hypothetical protein